MSTVRILGSQTLYAAAGSMFTLIVGLPLQVYVTRQLGADGIGLFGVIEGALATIGVFLGLGIAPTAVRFLPFHIDRSEYGSARTLIYLGITLILAVGLLSYGGIVAGLAILDHWWPELAEHHVLVAVMGLTVPLGSLSFFLSQVLRGFRDIKYLTVGNSILQLVAKAAVTIALLQLGWGVLGYGIATVVSIVCAILWMGFGVIRHINRLPNSGGAAELRQWAQYALITYLSGMVSGVPAYFDRFIIAYLAGVEVVGILVVARKLQQLPQVAVQMLLMVGAPMMAAAYGRNDHADQQHIYSLIKDWLVRASLPLLIFLGVFAQPVMDLFGLHSPQAGYVLSILVIGQLFNTFTGPIGTMAMMCGLERVTLQINTIMTGIGFLLMFVLIPGLGAVGAALAAVTGWVLLGTSLMIVTHRKLRLQWWDARYLKWIIPSILTVGTALVIRNSNFPSSALALAVYLVVLHVVFNGLSIAQGLHADDSELIRHLADTLIGRGGNQRAKPKESVK